MHITVTGNLGSGKTTICRFLSEKYNMEKHSTGTVQRELASQMNMSTLELNQLMKGNPKYDRMIDDETARISREKKDIDIIFDSRLAWYFAEKTFKVFISVSLEVAAKRIIKDKRGAVESYLSLEDAINKLTERANTENERYKDIYNINYMDFSNYNLIIDSTHCLPERLAEVIYHEAKNYEKNLYTTTKMLVSPKRLIFKEPIKEEDRKRLDSLISKYSNVSYYVDDVINVSKKDFNYVVEDCEDEGKAALLAGVNFIIINVL